VDEKSQIRALERTQPGLPINKGRCGIMTHDYKRNGATTLFSALEILRGKVIGRCHQRHRHESSSSFYAPWTRNSVVKFRSISSRTTMALTSTGMSGPG